MCTLIFSPLGSYASWKPFKLRTPNSRAFKVLQIDFWSSKLFHFFYWMASETQSEQMIYTSRNAYKMSENTRFVFLVLSPYSHPYPLNHKCTTNVWFAHLFKLSFLGVSASARRYAQNMALKTKQKTLKFQNTVLENPWIFGLKECTNPVTYFSGKQYCC